MTTTTTRFRLPTVFLAVTALIAALIAVLVPPAAASHQVLVAVNAENNECTSTGAHATMEVEIEVRDPITKSINELADGDITVQFDTIEAAQSGDPATAGTDYISKSGTVTIPAGSRQGTANISLRCDTEPENPEEFSVFFHSPSGASFDEEADQRALATILDGAPDPGPQFTITGPASPVTEDDPSTLNPPSVNAVFDITLDDTSGCPCSVDYSTRDGTATAEDDYNEESGTEPFTREADGGPQTQQVEISIKHDQQPEAQETFFVDLSNPAVADPTVTDEGIAKATAAALINDDDIPAVLIGEAVASESSPTLGVSFSLEGGVNAPEDIFVVWESAEGSASDGGDYTGTGGRVATRIESGTNSGSRAITLQDDTALEDWHESFYAVIHCIEADNDTACDEESTVATERNTFGRQAIQDDEPKINVDDATAVEGEKMTFTVTLEQFREDQDISVKYTTKDGDAKAGEDYKKTSGTLTWDETDRDENNKTKQVTVETLQDGQAEGNHAFTLELSEPSFAGIDNGSGEGLITDDDAFSVNAGPAQSGESAAEVSFTGSASGGTPPYTFTWDFGDGSAKKTGTTVRNRFAETGTFTVTLTVEDSTGATGTDTTTATITDSGKIERSFGSNREGTAIDVSRDHWNQADTVLLATGYAHADALAAGPLAKKLDAPLLLTNPNGLPDEVKQELDRLNASKVIILGGVHAVPQEQADELAASGYQIQRIAGVNRFGTAADIATEVGATSLNEVTIALGQHADENRDDWPDALSAGSFASLAEPLPSLLTHSSTVPQDTLDALAELDTETIFLLGGNVAISETVEQQLEAEGYTVQRVFGADRYATSVAAGEIAMDRYPAGQIHPVLATGQKFPDGLTGGALAGKVRGPVVLVPTDNLDNASSVRDFLREHANPFDVGTIAGGERVVSDNVQTQARSDIDTF